MDLLDNLPVAEGFLEAKGSLAADCWPAGFYITDGSGGEFSDGRRLRRVGLGMAHFSTGPSLDFLAVQGALRGGIAGRVQTVPRAELLAVVLALAHTVSVHGACLHCYCPFQYSQAPGYGV